MNCPNCNETLMMTERQGVEIDYCPKCRGVWLDRGELDKIIEKSAAYTPEADPGGYEEKRDYPPRDKYNDPYYQKNDPYYHKKKKKGFLGDFFDFD
jgi:uncharacterized protein